MTGTITQLLIRRWLPIRAATPSRLIVAGFALMALAANLCAASIDVGLPVTALEFSRDGNELLVGCTNQVRRYGWPSLAELEPLLPLEMLQINTVRLSPDGRKLLVAGGDPSEAGAVHCYAWPQRTRLYSVELHRDVVYAVAWSPDGTHWATASADVECKVADADNGQPITTFRGHSRPVLTIAYSTDGATLASAGVDQTIQLWNARDGQHIRTLNNHVNSVTALWTLPNLNGRERLLSSGKDRTLRLWEPAIGRLIRFERLDAIPAFVAQANSTSPVCVVTQAGEQFMTANAPWTRWERREAPWGSEASSPIYSIALPPNGKQLVLGTAVGRLVVVPLEDVH